MIKKSNKKLKFNIVDGLVLFLAIVCISTIITRAIVIEDKYQQINDKSCTIRFEFDVVDEVSLAVFQHIKAGESLAVLDKDSGNKFVIGSVVDDLAYTDDTQTKAYGYIVVEGALTKDGYKINDTELTINVKDVLNVFTENVIIDVNIVSFEWK